MENSDCRKYCLKCEREEDVFPLDEEGNAEYHWDFDASIGQGIPMCLGPFVTTPPPEISEEEWRQIFTTEETLNETNTY